MSVLLTAWAVGPAAAGPLGASQPVRDLYAGLLDAMQNGPSLGPNGRYAKLEPVVSAAFDVTQMTKTAVGAPWESLPPDQRQQLTAAFKRYMVATYASAFDDYSGERLEIVDEQPSSFGNVVRTQIVKANGERVNIDYLVRKTDGGWKVADVYLIGTISQLALRRSEFCAILRRQNVDALIARLGEKADLLIAASGP